MLKKIFMGMIRFYRNAVSPWTLPSCRYLPTCSAYAEEAIRKHGCAKGGWLSLRRLLRCHPFGGHGPDPVPSDSSAPSSRSEHAPACAPAGPRESDR